MKKYKDKNIKDVDLRHEKCRSHYITDMGF